MWELLYEEATVHISLSYEAIIKVQPDSTLLISPASCHGGTYRSEDCGGSGVYFVPKASLELLKDGRAAISLLQIEMVFACSI